MKPDPDVALVEKPRDATAATAAPKPETKTRPARTTHGPAKDAVRRPATPGRAHHVGGTARKAPASKPAAKARRNGASTKARALAKGAAGLDAVRLLRGLHASWQDAVEAHRLRVAGQFRLAEAGFAGKHKARDVEKARAALKVRLKPKKGRAKDLRRVEDALATVLARVGSD